MKTWMRTGLGRSREVECGCRSWNAGLTVNRCFLFFFLFGSDNVDSLGRKYLNEKNFEVETWLRSVLMRYVS